MKSRERTRAIPVLGERRSATQVLVERRPAIPGARVVGRWASMLALAGLLAACAGTGGGSGGKRDGSGVGAGAGTSPGAGAGARGVTRGGGYYLDDGPGDMAPPDLDAIPDAVPRAEPVRETNSRPYSVFGREYRPMTRIEPYRERGVATWYGRRYHGNATSSGERYDMYAMTAAHPTLPIPSYVRVTSLENQRSVVVRVNDRGPFLHGRLIDLSYTAAAKLGYVDQGSARVEVELITEFGESPRATAAQQRSPSGAAAAQSTAQSTAAPAAPITPITPITASAPVAPVAPVSTLAPAAPAAPADEPVRLTMASEPPAGSDPAARDGKGRLETAAPERAGTIETASDPAHAAQRAVGAANDAGPQRLDVSTEIRNADGTSQPATANLTAATPVPALDRGYWLQLGAFGSAGNANAARERLSRQLTHLGAPIDVVADGGLFKLQAGPWPTQEAARAAADRVRAQAEVQPFAIQR